MNKVPISLIIDDPAPRVFVYYEHSPHKFTLYGEPLKSEVPNSFLFDFCDVMEHLGIKGKFSVVPCPGGRGDIVNGIPGFDYGEVKEWLDTVISRVSKYFSICPEVLTHAEAIDLETGKLLNIREDDWAATQNRTTFTPYIAKALTLLTQAGLRPTGVTSPWEFGVQVEDEYSFSIGEAFEQVTGAKNSWYFCRERCGVPNAGPWIANTEGGRTVVSIPNTVSEHFWQSLDTPDTSEEFVLRAADGLISADGTKGEIADVLNSGGWPIILSHWQSLFSNGPGTGLRILNEVARRVNEKLSDRVEWMSFEEIMNLTLEQNN